MSESEALFDPEALRRARVAAGLSQAQLARALGLAGGEAVYTWERGIHRPRPALLARAAGVLGVAVAELLVAGEGPVDLRRLRLLAGRSVAELADAVGVSPGTYRQWEAGRIRRPPNRACVEALSRACGVSVEALAEAIRAGMSR